mmetsp:Transcript_31145/g.62798  ORF Transcript_31145/g.62798 Transcript_31145/m.62798 type:complete len:294 (-) Transcript_31145:124-1005(-)
MSAERRSLLRWKRSRIEWSDSSRLNASKMCPNSSPSSQPKDSYRSSTSRRSVVARFRMMLWTLLDLLKRSSRLSTSSGDTRRFDRSMYPLSLSTRSTSATSCRPTLISFLTERMRRRESSERRIMPSVSSYSSSDTYTPMTSMRLTSTTTVSSTSGYLFRYILHRRFGSCPSMTCGTFSPGDTVRVDSVSASAPFFPRVENPSAGGTYDRSGSTSPSLSVGAVSTVQFAFSSSALILKCSLVYGALSTYLWKECFFIPFAIAEVSYIVKYPVSGKRDAGASTVMDPSSNSTTL